MDLNQDYDAIRWIQANVSGTPVIIEGYVSEYKWGSRYTIYTGLPGVIGWNWHQRQQRAINPDDWVYERIDAVNEFYSTSEIERCAKLSRYTVSITSSLGNWSRQSMEETPWRNFPSKAEKCGSRSTHRKIRPSTGEKVGSHG
jgi:uncharacterized membrane protein